ncbi:MULTISPECIES: YtxH domain-containing protein [Staphylococcus]|uniref:YtxH domain-containing protein n=1 Tax=Staphylococcus TaxID=1279 RepID=UPI000AAC124A|nr:YtxH domain-containing protein [Staphylococcus haemolyticus]MEB2657088.1 YtxH domain-containing protein [Staphylococcus haemolyticus]
MSKKYNRDAFEVTNSGNDLHGKGANQQDSATQSNATKHYNRDEFEKNNFGHDLHDNGPNQKNGKSRQGSNTEHYNRDEFVTNNTGKDLHGQGENQNSNNYDVSNSQYSHNKFSSHPSRKDFVISFITGALIGSAVGLFYKNKAEEKIDSAKTKEKELRNRYQNIKQQTESNIENVKQKIDDFKNRDNSEVSNDELVAQQNAIKAETSNNLADQSPQAQEIQDAKAEAKKDSKSKEISATELAAQQNAVKVESSNNNLSDPSIKDDASHNKNVTAKNLASAAKTKKSKLDNDSNVANKTKNLLEEPSVAKSKGIYTVPNLVTKEDKTINTNEDQVKNNQAHATSKFENGVITHDTKSNNEKSKGNSKQSQNEPKVKNKTPKQQQRVEKAKSKIDKRTFND